MRSTGYTGDRTQFLKECYSFTIYMIVMYSVRILQSLYLDFVVFSYVFLGTHQLFLKAKKYHFGYAETDFVGKVLSEKGLLMSQTKIGSVLDFPKPVIAKQLKRFLGLVNYFHDFIRNQSYIVHPLHLSLLNYKENSMDS